MDLKQYLQCQPCAVQEDSSKRRQVDRWEDDSPPSDLSEDDACYPSNKKKACNRIPLANLPLQNSNTNQQSLKREDSTSDFKSGNDDEFVPEETDDDDDDGDQKETSLTVITGGFDYEPSMISFIRLANQCALLSSSPATTYYEFLERELGRSVFETKLLHGQEVIGDDFTLSNSSSMLPSSIETVTSLWQFYYQKFLEAKGNGIMAEVVVLSNERLIQLFADRKKPIHNWTNQEQYDVLLQLQDPFWRVSRKEMKMLYNLSGMNELIGLKDMNDGQYFRDCTDQRSRNLDVILNLVKGGMNGGITALPHDGGRLSRRSGCLRFSCDSCSITFKGQAKIDRHMNSCERALVNYGSTRNYDNDGKPLVLPYCEASFNDLTCKKCFEMVPTFYSTAVNRLKHESKCDPEKVRKFVAKQSAKHSANLFVKCEECQMLVRNGGWSRAKKVHLDRWCVLNQQLRSTVENRGDSKRAQKLVSAVRFFKKQYPGKDMLHVTFNF